MALDDRSAIVNVVNLYAVALDSHRYDLFAQVFTPDVRCDFGGGAAFTDRATLERVFPDIHAAFSATQHIAAGHVVTLAGDEATCFAYVHARFRRVVDGTDALFDSTGWYDDRLVRTAEGWRIRDRVSRMVSWTGDHRVMQAMPDVDANFELLSLADEAAAGRVAFLGGR